MAKKFVYVQKGEIIDYLAGANYAVGDPVNLTSCIGIAETDIVSGAVGAVRLHGRFTGPAVTNASFAVGDVLFWDPIALNLTKVSTSNIPAGICVATKATSTAVADVQIGRTMITLDNP